jgi:CBS domain-containing protein
MASSPFPPGYLASDFPFPAAVIEIDSKALLNDGFKVLVAHNLLSAPVYDADKRAYLGFFDIMDACRVGTMTKLLQGTADNSQIGQVLCQLSDREHFAPWVPVALDTPMSEILDILKTRAKRVPVLKDGRCVKIISQSLVAKLVHDWLVALPDSPPRFKQTASESGLALKAVITVPEHALAKDTFALLLDKNLSAIGVMDEDGCLLTCLTAKDVRLLPQLGSGEMSADELLDMPVVDFVSRARLQYEKLGKAR